MYNAKYDIHSFRQSLVRPSVRSFIDQFISSFIRPFIQTCRPSIHPPIHVSFTHQSQKSTVINTLTLRLLLTSNTIPDCPIWTDTSRTTAVTGCLSGLTLVGQEVTLSRTFWFTLNWYLRRRAAWWDRGSGRGGWRTCQ